MLDFLPAKYHNRLKKGFHEHHLLNAPNTFGTFEFGNFIITQLMAEINSFRSNCGQICGQKNFGISGGAKVVGKRSILPRKCKK